MSKAQYAILRFAKYKGPTISRIEAHNERTKEFYASNPDIKTELSKYNFHLVNPKGKYRAEADGLIREAGCKARKDSVRMVETLITASPEFFSGKKPGEVRAFFEYALEFLKTKQGADTILSAVVHVDEKTPHMHLCFVPITADGRLSAKDIVGNRKKLTQWQDEYWSYMVKKYPDLERGESASKTGREHIPPRLFKEAAHLNRQRDKLMQLLSEVNMFNAKGKAAEIEALLEDYIPGVEKMQTKLKKYDGVYKELKAENAKLEKDSRVSVKYRMNMAEKIQELEDLKKAVDHIPPEILQAYQSGSNHVHHSRKEKSL